VDLAQTSSPCTEQLSGLGEGSDRTFNTVALGSGDARLYTGKVAGATLAEGEDALVFISLEELSATATIHLGVALAHPEVHRSKQFSLYRLHEWFLHSGVRPMPLPSRPGSLRSASPTNPPPCERGGSCWPESGSC
jgi:hypothetical protein